MNLGDLRIFLCAARRSSLAEAAQELHLTPSAISKALRRLEDSLGMPLFDRAARQLVLNEAGARLLERGQALLALAEQTRADIMGDRAQIECRVGGPAVLLWREAAALGHGLRSYPQANLRLQAMFEDEALAALGRGELQLAIVTGEADMHGSRDWVKSDLGSLTQYLVAGSAHPLLAQAKRVGKQWRARTAQVLEHDFACPTRSLFCGESRGTRSDGWRDDQLPRRIRYWAEDLQLLMSFVRSGTALAYLPDFALGEPGVERIQVTDCPYECVEQVWAVWDGTKAPQWLRALAEGLARKR